MAEALDYVMDSGRRAYALIKGSTRPFFMDLLRITALEQGLGILSLLIMAAILLLLAPSFGMQWLVALAGGTAEPEPPESVAVPMMLASLVWLAISLATSALATVGYNVVENRESGKQTGIIKQFMQNLFPAIKLTLINWAVILVLSMPLMFALTIPAIGPEVFCIIGLVMLLALAAFMLLTQFSMLEVILRKKGIIEAMKASAGLARKRLLATVLFSGALLLVIGLVGLLSALAQWVLRSIPLMLGGGGLFIGLAVYLLFFFVVMTFISAAGRMITFPLAYHFWKKGDETQGPAEPPRRKKAIK